MRKHTLGQALVEFALIFPVLLAAMLAIVDGAFLFQAYITVNHAAHEAARFAVVYRPVQGECLNRDDFGSPILEPYPNCPTDYAEAPNETDDHYYDRRVALIKDIALDATLGLQTDDVCTSLGCIQSNWVDPGMIGVRVWGFQSFESAEEEDKPGLPGLPVRVEVVHNVPLVVYGGFFPNAMVRVSSNAEMVNEGIQVGYGNQAPPTFEAPVAAVPPGPGAPTPTYEPSPTPGPTPTATLQPVYAIDLSPADATNVLPDQREHALRAHVTDDLGQDVAGARVTFLTDEGSFQKSGTGDNYIIIPTGADDGSARPVLYANEPTTATITAWLDYNLSGGVDPGEPFDTARKVWVAPGSYLVVSNHNPEPDVTIAVSVYDHPLSQSPLSLLWCPTSITSTQIAEQMAFPVDLDAGGDAPDVPVHVPQAVAGLYRIESHEGDVGPGNCGDPLTLVAYSANLEIATVPPDLEILAATVVYPELVAPGEPITLAITVTNQSPVVIDTGPFDLDTYVDLPAEPYLQQLGETKQWLPNLGPFETTVVTTTVTVYTAEDHEAWFQVDTTDYVDEGDEGGEDNNVFGPLALEMADCVPFRDREDDFNAGLGAQWTGQDIGNPLAGSQQTAGGQLEVTANGSDIWGSYDRFRYVHQSPLSGDFRMTLRVLDVSDFSNDWAKSGLMVRESTAPGSRHYSIYQTRNRGISRQFRANTGGTSSSSTTGGLNPPRYLRIEREGSTLTASYSSDGESWTTQGGSRDMNFPAAVHVGIATTSHDSGRTGTAVYDDFEICRPTGFEDVDPPSSEVHPPGLIQCAELLSVPGFEGNPATVFSYWTAGDAAGRIGAYQRTSAEFYRGSFAMRLHASNSVIPCSANELQPFLYQRVDLPDEVFAHSTLVVSGQYLVAGSLFECSQRDSPDADDQLNLSLRQTDGTVIVGGRNLINGGTTPYVWNAVYENLETGMGDPGNYAGQTLRLQWDGVNDGDINGTWFYIDDVSAQLCTEWEVPDDEPGLSNIGGLVTTRGENNVPTAMPGTFVWAYAQGSDVYHTRSIHDGTYSFFNIPPGTYIVYAEAWVGGELRTVSTSVTVEADERLTDINLLLQ